MKPDSSAADEPVAPVDRLWPRQPWYFSHAKLTVFFPPKVSETDIDQGHAGQRDCYTSCSGAATKARPRSPGFEPRTVGAVSASWRAGSRRCRTVL